MLFDLAPGYDAIALKTPTLPPARHTNCYIVGRLRALVIDPGSPFGAEQRRLQRRLFELLGGGGSLAAVFLTHHHPDHLGAVESIARTFSVAIWAHQETIVRLPRNLQELPHRAIQDGEMIHIDRDRRLQTMHSPGHARGHLCLYERRCGSLIGGDNVLGLGSTLIDPPEGHMATYLDSLRKMAALSPRRILPAHGPVLHPGLPAIEALIEHRLQRERRVLDAIRHHQNPSAEHIARIAYAEVSPLVFRLALRSTLAHLQKLQEEGHVSETAGIYRPAPGSEGANTKSHPIHGAGALPKPPRDAR